MDEDMMTNEATLIEVRGVSRIYGEGATEVHALREVDLTIGQGEFTALAGPSGSGKTTLLNVIGALDAPTKGSVSVDGHSVSDLNRRQAAEFRLQHVGFIFQAYNLIPVLSAYENAEFVLMLKGLGKEDRQNMVMPLMEEVGIADIKDRRPHEISGGQQQRVAVVRAMAGRPNIILADEPTANLDSKTSAALLDLMLELNQEHEVTFIFSSHDHQVMERSRRLVSLDSGRIVSDEKR